MTETDINDINFNYGDGNSYTFESFASILSPLFMHGGTIMKVPYSNRANTYLL